MNRIGLFLVIIAVGVASLLLTFAWYLASYQSTNASFEGMMGQMMGNQYAYGMTTPMPAYLWGLVAVLIVLIIGGIGGVAYYLAYPEIRGIVVPAGPAQNVPGDSNSSKVDWSVLVRTSKPEEKRVLKVIASHNGKYLQKFIVKESGLSRLKTHRIISRFAERGVVVVAKSGNTNEVSLAPWLKPEMAGGKGPEA
jgi:uncharacterized membrane protein